MDVLDVMGSQGVNDESVERRLAYGEGRQALVDAAIKIVARDGMPRLTYRSLTAEAGVSQGSLRHHFPHLISVLEAALESCLDVSKAYMLLPKTDLNGLFANLAQMMNDRPEIPCFLVEVYTVGRHTPELLEIIQRHQDSYRERVEHSLVSLGLQVDLELVDTVLAMGDGLMYQRVIFGEQHEPALRRQVEGFQKLLLSQLFRERVESLGQKLNT